MNRPGPAPPLTGRAGEHPSEEALERFADAAASRARSRVVVRHLLAGCEQCGAAIRFRAFPESKLISLGESSWSEKELETASRSRIGSSDPSSEAASAPEMQLSCFILPNANAAATAPPSSLV